jgi:hypothetical protein
LNSTARERFCKPKLHQPTQNGALPRHLVVLAQDGRQTQGIQVVFQKNLRCVGCFRVILRWISAAKAPEISTGLPPTGPTLKKQLG